MSIHFVRCTNSCCYRVADVAVDVLNVPRAAVFARVKKKGCWHTCFTEFDHYYCYINVAKLMYQVARFWSLGNNLPVIFVVAAVVCQCTCRCQGKTILCSICEVMYCKRNDIPETEEQFYTSQAEAPEGIFVFLLSSYCSSIYPIEVVDSVPLPGNAINTFAAFLPLVSQAD